MGKINVLDKHIAELIAAGEVVERPSSVIKELIENSIDANATKITIEIKNGGITYMRITDNGCGIENDDIRNAFVRNATSKIKAADDLNFISTLGFRGEALSSICAVSKVELISRTSNQKMGSHYIIEGGEEILFDDEYGCSEGTTIIVRNLFYNTPARMKFLKKDSSEANSVLKIIDRVALSHPEVSFKVIKDNKQELNTPGNGQVESAVYAVYGKEFFQSLINLDYNLNGVKLKGFVSKPTQSRATRNMQHFFINGRYVKSRTAMVALEEAFKGSIMVQKFPACIMYIEIPYDTVDVNVHPSKVEVRFINEKPIFDAIYYGVKTALMKKDNSVLFDNKEKFNLNVENTQVKAISNFEKVNTVFEPSNLPKNNVSKDIIKSLNNNDYVLKENKTENVLNFDSKKTQTSENEDLPEVFIPSKFKNGYLSNNNKKDSVLFENLNVDKKEKVLTTQDENKSITEKENVLKEPIYNLENNVVQTELLQSDNFNIKIIGEAFNTYIIVEKNNSDLILVDKHAAHERMIYEDLISKKLDPVSQLFIEPIIVSLSKDEYASIIDNIKLFTTEGFDVEDFGNSSIIVRAAPTYLDNVDVKNIIIQMAGYILENKKNVSCDYVNWLYENMACRAAIKAGKEAKYEEMQELIKKILKENPKYCPHGRPIAITLKKRDIEKRFGRV